MSFSGTVKEELAEYISPARHCQLAELAALFHFGGRLTVLARAGVTCVWTRKMRQLRESALHY